MTALGVVEVEVSYQSLSKLPRRLVGAQVDILVLDAAPEPFDENVVDPAAFAVHADVDIVVFEHTGEGVAGELHPLVGVEDLGLAKTAQRLVDQGRNPSPRCWTAARRAHGASANPG